jgi:hypothetical protein
LRLLLILIQADGVAAVDGVPEVGAHIGFHRQAADVVAALQACADPAAPTAQVAAGVGADMGGVEADALVDQLCLGFDHPVVPQANGDPALHRQGHGAAFADLPLPLLITTQAADPGTAGRQVQVPALGAAQAPEGAEAVALQIVDAECARVVEAARYGGALGLDHVASADQADALGGAAAVLDAVKHGSLAQLVAAAGKA